MLISHPGGFMHPEQLADLPGGTPKRWLNRTVGGAGLTSALGDFCYETTTVILPGFLAVLGIPAAALGFIEGVADAVSSFTKMVAGFIADKLGHRKKLVMLGYALTPVGQVLIALSVGWPLILAGRMVSWFGKGLRGPLRDAIVAQSIAPETRGRAFGFHRAMDTLGAVGGPLLGVALLGWAQGLGWADPAAPFRLVFWLTLVPGLLAVLAFFVFVRDPEHSPNPALQFVAALRGLPARFKRYLGAVGLFGMGDFSHSLLILAATQLLSPSMGVVRAAQVAGLLYVLRNVVQLLTAYPVGALADRYGARRILVFGYMCGVLTAVLTVAAFAFHAANPLMLGAIFVAAGLYMAVQEALEATVTADLVDADARGVGYGALGTVNGGAKFISSTGVGLLWTGFSPLVGFGAAAALMAAGTVAMRRVR
ncbi:MAG: MFS transporter [SAR202 cluster bacterium]|nr:MFS transporter [SAR202 cluster bacterium]